MARAATRGSARNNITGQACLPMDFTAQFVSNRALESFKSGLDRGERIAKVENVRMAGPENRHEESADARSGQQQVSKARRVQLESESNARKDICSPRLFASFDENRA